jgi:dihydroxyacetone kinase
MTRLYNDPKEFADDALAGLVAAYPELLLQVYGGAVRATASPPGEVAIVIGGGSGHYPAFAGWVGPGLAHGAACGNVFASPSAAQVYSVIRAADNGGGVLLTFGNYAGDVLHFGQAAERARAEGMDIRILPVTDDIASAPPEKPEMRRGTAGDLLVFKVAAAAAERGADLDEVERIARHANARTRSFGVAFDGCTLPGSDAPLFTVPSGLMSVGLGVHGEPGIRDEPMGTAADVADLLLDGILAEEPPRGEGGYDGQVIVLLNGLGTVKYEELFVVFRRIAERLDAGGFTMVQPEVGELMSSLDMAGLSLTITFLDAELAELWGAPVNTVAFRRGAVADVTSRTAPVSAGPVVGEIPPATEASQAFAGRVVKVLDVLRDTAVAQETYFGRIDAIAGDGDHGQGMTYGTTGAAKAAQEAVAAGAGARTTLVRAGDAWSEAAGGTSGALWGAALTAFGGRLSDESGAEAVTAGVEAILRLGGAQVGDKTMVDAAVPFQTTLAEQFAAGAPLTAAWTAAAQVATEAAAATADIVAQRGRSRVLGEKSLGTPDPGATSFALLMTAVVKAGLLTS